MKSRKDRFDGEKEFGKRLRECRLRAGLTQQKLATAMGRQGKGSHHVAGRLERGEVPNPGVGLLADYLRACRASFADIQDVLDRYTARQTVVEVETRKALAKVREFLPAKIDRAVERFDRGIRRRAEEKNEPLPLPQERVKRVRSFALSQTWRRRVRRKVLDVIEAQEPRPRRIFEEMLQNYASEVWRVLNLTRKRHSGKREALLDEADRHLLREGGPDPMHLAAVRDALLSFFRQAELAGQLDAAPQLEPGETQPKHGFQPKPDRRPERDAWDKARAARVEELWQETSLLPELAGLDPRRVPLYQSVVRGLCSIVDHQAPESDECRRQVEALATDEYYTSRGRDPALVRRLAGVVIPRWEELRRLLGPHPLGRVRPPGKPK
jgi:transcriptional regulator with XRE-family HTH domain